MTAVQFWVSALRLTLRFTQRQEREGGSLSVSLLLPGIELLGLSRSSGPWWQFASVTSQHKSSVSPCQSRRQSSELNWAPTAVSCVRLISLFAPNSELISWFFTPPVFSQTAATFLERVFAWKPLTTAVCFVLVVWKWWRSEPEPPLPHEFTTADLETQHMWPGACLRQNDDIWPRVSSSNILMAHPAHSKISINSRAEKRSV